MNKAFKAKPYLLELAKINRMISALYSMTKGFKRLTREAEIKTLEVKLSLLK